MAVRNKPVDINGVLGVEQTSSSFTPIGAGSPTLQGDERALVLSIDSIQTSLANLALRGVYVPPPTTGQDQSPIISAAIAAVAQITGGNGGVVQLGAGTYTCLTPISDIAAYGTLIQGLGAATVINWLPPVDANEHVLFRFKAAGAGIIQRCGVSGINFTGATNTKRVAIEVVDASEFVAHDLIVSGWGGGQSEGLRLKGREAMTIERIQFACPRPLRIMADPNAVVALDHAHFSDCYLLCTDNAEQCVLVDAGIPLQNITFDGYQAWVNGLYGLLWNDNASAGVSRNLRISNVRFERQANVGGAMVRIALTGANGLRGLTIDNMNGGDPGYDYGGAYLRGIANGLLNGDRFGSPGPAVSLDIDATCTGLVRIQTETAGVVNTGALGPIGTANSRVITYV